MYVFCNARPCCRLSDTDRWMFGSEERVWLQIFSSINKIVFPGMKVRLMKVMGRLTAQKPPERQNMVYLKTREFEIV